MSNQDQCICREQSKPKVEYIQCDDEKHPLTYCTECMRLIMDMPRQSLSDVKRRFRKQLDSLSISIRMVYRLPYQRAEGYMIKAYQREIHKDKGRHILFYYSPSVNQGNLVPWGVYLTEDELNKILFTS